MTASGTETLTAALRRLADEHASGVLSIATPGRDVLIELMEGLPVGIGPAHDVTPRVGRDARPGVIAAAVIDDLIDRTVAAIVHGGGDWAWNATSEASFMPLPEGLGTELSRRAVDAAQAMAELGDDVLLQPGRALETHGEVARIAALFDGRTGLEDVARSAGRPLPAVATIAAALVGAGVLTTGEEPAGPVSWTDAVAADDDDEDDDEPELWVMDEPDPEPEPVEEPAPRVADEPAASGQADLPAATAAGGPRTTADDLDTGWDDTTWLDELDTPRAPAHDDAPAPVEGDARAALSSMIGELQSDRGAEATPPTSSARPPAAPPEPAADAAAEPPAEGADEPAPTRKEPKAQPGEVAEFLRELSRLALDDD